METEYIKKPGLKDRKEVLIEALERAAKENGLFLNTNYKQQPHFYNKELQITPVNSLMMAMHSDNGNFKSNAYTTFQNLQANNAAIRRGQKEFLSFGAISMNMLKLRTRKTRLPRIVSTNYLRRIKDDTESILKKMYLHFSTLTKLPFPLFTRIHIRRISMIPGRLHRMMRKSYA